METLILSHLQFEKFNIEIKKKDLGSIISL